MRLVSLWLVVALALTACGSAQSSGDSSADEVDRSDVEEVAVATVTAFLSYDFDTLRDLVAPDQSETIDSIEQAAQLSPSPKIKIKNVTATVVERSDATATVAYAGEYCLPERTTVVPVTAIGSERDDMETIGSTSVVEAERCFDLDEIFRTDRVEFQRIDGDWYARLPA